METYITYCSTKCLIADDKIEPYEENKNDKTSTEKGGK